MYVVFTTLEMCCSVYLLLTVVNRQQLKLKVSNRIYYEYLLYVIAWYDCFFPYATCINFVLCCPLSETGSNQCLLLSLAEHSRVWECVEDRMFLSIATCSFYPVEKCPHLQPLCMCVPSRHFYHLMQLFSVGTVNDECCVMADQPSLKLFK